MKIGKPEQGGDGFHADDIAAGVVFEWNGSYFIKVDQEMEPSDTEGQRIAAVNLDDGSLLYPDDECRILPNAYLVTGDDD